MHKRLKVCTTEAQKAAADRENGKKNFNYIEIISMMYLNADIVMNRYFSIEII